jgi:serine/threonine protein kinase
MEYVDGENLAEVLARRGSLPPEEARGLALQAAKGLGPRARGRARPPRRQAAEPDPSRRRHAQGRGLRDRPRRRDDGAHAGREPSSALRPYLSPEQALGEKVTPATDVYSLGAVLYELLAGRPPLQIESLDDLARRADLEIAPLPEVPRDLEDVVMHCLVRNPEYRPRDAAQLAQELATGETAATKPLPAPSRRESFRDRRLIWAAVAGLVVLAAVFLAVVLASGGNSKPSRGTAVTVEQPKVQPIPRGADAQSRRATSPPGYGSTREARRKLRPRWQPVPARRRRPQRTSAIWTSSRAL